MLFLMKNGMKRITDKDLSRATGRLVFPWCFWGEDTLSPI